MEEFRDPTGLPDDELLALHDAHAAEHRWLCLRRWALFDQIDVIRVERVRRLRDGLAGLGTAAAATDRSHATQPREFRGLGNGDPMGPDVVPPLSPLPLVTPLADDQIRDLLRTTKSDEDDVSLRRQIVWARLKALERELHLRGRAREG